MKQAKRAQYAEEVKAMIDTIAQERPHDHMNEDELRDLYNALGRLLVSLGCEL